MAGYGASIRRYALRLGALGFAAGFFGPMILTPDANQGPMLGIFITGPGGLLLGALWGAVHAWRENHRKAKPGG